MVFQKPLHCLKERTAGGFFFPYIKVFNFVFQAIAIAIIKVTIISGRKHHKPRYFTAVQSVGYIYSTFALLENCLSTFKIKFLMCFST